MSQSEVLFVLKEMKKEHIRKNGNVDASKGFVVDRNELEKRVMSLLEENDLDGFDVRFRAYLRKLEKWGYIKRIWGGNKRKRKIVRIKVFI